MYLVSDEQFESQVFNAFVKHLHTSCMLLPALLQPLFGISTSDLSLNIDVSVHSWQKNASIL